jgi:Lysozyme like domain
VAINGTSLAYVITGGVLLWSGIQNVTIQGVLESLAKGSAPSKGPAEQFTASTTTASTSTAAPSAVPSGSATASYKAIEMYWIAAGGPPSVASTAAAITGAESSFNASAVQQGQPAETTGWGLWQITPTSGITQNGQFGNLLDPSNNARAAVYLYKNAGNSFSPWATYNSGAYQEFVQ